MKVTFVLLTLLIFSQSFSQVETKNSSHFFDEINLSSNLVMDTPTAFSAGFGVTDYVYNDSIITGYWGLHYRQDMSANIGTFEIPISIRFHFGKRNSWFANVGWHTDFDIHDRVLYGGGILGMGKEISLLNRIFIISPVAKFDQTRNKFSLGIFQLQFSLLLNSNKRKSFDPKPFSDEDNYWGSNEAIFMESIDSADLYLQKSKEEKLLLIEEQELQERKLDTINQRRDTLKWEKDSIRLTRKKEVDKRLKKNTIKLEILGVSYIVGLVYERTIYRNKFDLNLRAGILPFPARIPSLSLGAVFTTNKYHINPIGIISFSTLGGSDFENFGPTPMISLGATFQFSKRWSAQVYQSSALAAGSEYPEFTLYWGGINLGYGF
jgi:hypothetical protein